MRGEAKPVDLVLEGGGVKGIGLLGAVLALSEAGYRFERVAGTSAGAIVAALVVAYQQAGRDLHELEAVLNEIDYSRFAEEPWIERRTGRVGEAVTAVVRGGAHSGDYLTEWLGEELEKAGVRTFGDLRIIDPEASLRDNERYRLVVHTSDITRHVLVRLPWDYPHYGRNIDDELVVDAVRASMSIPLYFRPVQVDTPRGTATWVDGGLLSNFPITVFDRTDGRAPRWPTWGVKLSGKPVAGEDSPVRTGPGIAINCLRTLTGEWNQYRLNDDGVGRRTVFVDTLNISATDFDIGPDQQRTLFDNGRAAANRFLETVPAVPQAQRPVA